MLRSLRNSFCVNPGVMSDEAVRDGLMGLADVRGREASTAFLPSQCNVICRFNKRDVSLVPGTPTKCCTYNSRPEADSTANREYAVRRFLGRQSLADSAVDHRAASEIAIQRREVESL